MRPEYIEQMETDQLRATLDGAVVVLANQEEEGNTVAAHDTRCLLDQLTAELESRPDDAET